jgi:hypothetical protein
MLPKQRHSYGRSRMPHRHTRRGGAQREGAGAAMALAQRTACHFVAARWPELATVVPVVSTQLLQPPSPELLERLGLRADELGPAPSNTAYTFTFVGEITCADGRRTPLVASVTVDGHQRIIKTSVSK